jgi:hypothetical protein
VHADPRFGPATAALLNRAAEGITANETAAFVQDVHRAIEPFDVAGLCASPRNHWYPVNADDLKQAAWKIEATEQEIDSMLERAGFIPK